MLVLLLASLFTDCTSQVNADMTLATSWYLLGPLLNQGLVIEGLWFMDEWPVYLPGQMTDKTGSSSRNDKELRV